MNKKGSYPILIYFVALSLCLMTQNCFAIQWAKSYGGSNSEYPNSIQQTTDGGYIVAGYTTSFGAFSDDYWILKLDSYGTVTWQKTYGGGSSDQAHSIQQTTDGGYIVVGYTRSFGTGNTIWILKLDEAGTVSWQKAYGGGAFASGLGFPIQQTMDGGYIVAGYTASFGAGNNDFLVLKLDVNGNVSWQKTYGGINNEGAYWCSIQQTTDEGYIVAGYTDSYGAGEEDFWVFKLDASGNVSWQKTYGGSDMDYATSIRQTTDGGYIVAGYTCILGLGCHTWILKLDSGGNVTWQKTYGGGNFYALSIQQTSDMGYIVGGRMLEGYGYYWILKLDQNGTVSWEKTYAAIPYDYFFQTMQQTRDGGYIVVGLIDSSGIGASDFWILKLDGNGEINNCDIIGSSTATVENTDISAVTSAASISTLSPTITDTAITPQVSTAEVETQCFAPDWFPTEPPSQNKLNGVWGYLSSGPTPEHEFYAVGEGGTIIHFDGIDWTSTGSPTSEDLYGIWGSSETNIFAVGDNSTIVRYDEGWESMTHHSLPTTNLKDVWGSSPGDVYAVGEGGIIAHFDGTGWSEITPHPTTATLRGIWGSASDDYVAVGEGGTIVRYNGTSWATESGATFKDLNDVWGSGSDNIYAVGAGGTIIHYTGTSWVPVTSPTSANLRGIWGSAEDNIFAVGENGSILYYDGVSWTKMDSGSQDSLVSTFGTLNPRVMVVGHDGIILTLPGPSVQGKICNACTGAGIAGVTVEFDENKTGRHQTETTGPLGIYPAISAAGGIHDILFTDTDYNDGTMQIDFPNLGAIFDHVTYLVPVSGSADCISGTVTREVTLGGKPFDRGLQNIEVRLYQGGNQEGSTITDIGGNYHFTGLVGSGPYTVKPVIVGSECSTDPPESEPITIPTADQYSFELICPEEPSDPEPYWSTMTYPTGIDKVQLHDVWGSAVDNIFAVGDGGTIIHYDGNMGSTWTAKTSGTSKNLKGIWGSSGTNIYAVGSGGTVLKTGDGGTSWSPMTSTAVNNLNGIWGDSGSDIFAVGDGGEVIHYDGTSWSGQTSNTTEQLLGVWGTSGSDVYAVGNSYNDVYWKRTVIHYNGTVWSEITGAGNGVHLMSPWGSSASDVTAAGSFGNIVRYDGTGWKQLGGPTEKTLHALWGTSGSDIYAVGYNGVIAHYDGTEWSTREPDEPHDLYGIWGTTDPEIYAVAVGDGGAIYEYRGDIDGDGHADDVDNCIDIENADQTNSDADSYGDACDNCPTLDNEDQANSDYDTKGNICDNCPYSTNEGQANDDADTLGNVCDNCPTVTNEDQADDYPSGGNNCGDACECEGNFDGDQDCDGTDAASFKADFGRSQYKDPCTDTTPCQGDFECDVDVDGTDAAGFKADFGRSQYKDPCPDCPTNPWCNYPE